MKKLIGNLNTWQIVMIIFLLLCAFLAPYNCSLNSSTKVVRAQQVDYDAVNVKYYMADSTVELIRVDTSYRVGDIWEGWIFHYRIVP